MPSDRNIQQLKELKESLSQAKAVILSDYSGIGVNEINRLRNEIVEAGGEFRVAKNTLLKLAFDKDIELDGPTAVLFAYKDKIGPLKKLNEFIEKNELGEIKFGFMDGKLLEKEKILQLAKLPGAEVLQGQLVGLLNSPFQGLVFTLEGKLREFIGILEEIKENKK